MYYFLSTHVFKKNSTVCKTLFLNYFFWIILIQSLSISNINADSTTNNSCDHQNLSVQRPDKQSYETSITLTNVCIHQDDCVVFAKPGDILNGHLDYLIDSHEQSPFHDYHLVIGLKGVGAQVCVLHSYGLWDSKGTAKFLLKAPQDPGLYEVCYIYNEAKTCEQALLKWFSNSGSLGSEATIGAIIVEN